MPSHQTISTLTLSVLNQEAIKKAQPENFKSSAKQLAHQKLMLKRRLESGIDLTPDELNLLYPAPTVVNGTTLFEKIPKKRLDAIEKANDGKLRADIMLATLEKNTYRK